MKNIMRAFSKKIDSEKKEIWIQQSIKLIYDLALPCKVILIGSALGEDFDTHSDLDFVVLFASAEKLKLGQSILYRNTSSFPTLVDFICVTEDYFEIKSKIGGVLQIAAEEGRCFTI
ncbi:MAG: hypothetical protein ACOYOK_12595 [Pseudobdellovibrionaceae bacterium]